MDAILEQRWTDSLPPFDGYTLAFAESPHKVVGIAIVRFIFAELDSKFGLDEELFVNEDWHVHDGFINDSKLISKSILFSELETQPEKWIRVIDWQVYWGIYDTSNRFYLRFGLEEDEPMISIDLTTDETTVREMAAKIQTVFETDVELVDAKEYHDRIYGG